MRQEGRLPGALERLAPGVLFVALLCAVWADPLFVRRNFGGRDWLGYNLPVELVVHDAWARGRIPVWVSEISGGRPLAANPNVGAFYPARPLLALVPFPLAMRLLPILHWAIAGLGAMAFARCLGVSRAGSFLAAVTYALSGVGVSQAQYTNYHPGMALLPWVLWAAARPGGGFAARALRLAVLLGLDFYAGDVFTTGLAVAGVLLWAVTEEDRSRLKRAASELGAALLLAGLLAAPQLLASALWVPLTNRAVLGLKLGEAVSMSLSPWRVLELLVPFPFGPTWALESSTVWGRPAFCGKSVGFYSSLYAGGLAALGAVLIFRLRARGTRFARIYLLSGFLLAALPSLVPESWAQKAAPVALRYPEKFAVAIALSLALGAALVFDHWEGGPRRLRWLLAVGGGLAAAALLSVMVPGALGRVATALVGAPASLAPVAARQLPGALAEAGLLWMATVLALALRSVPGRAAAGSAVLILTVVLVASNRRIAPTFPQDSLLAPTPFARFVARHDREGAYRTMGYVEPPEATAALVAADPATIDFSRRVWTFFTPVLWGKGQVFNADTDHGDLSRTESLRRVFEMAALYKDASPFFGALSLRFGLRARDQPSFAGYHRVHGDALQDWDEHELPFPDIRLLRQWRTFRSATAALRSIPSLASGEIALETENAAQGSSRVGTAEVLERSPERLVVATDSPDETWLFVLRGYWPFRDVLVDGQETEVVPAQLAFSAARLPAGKHRVEWIERLPGFSMSRWGPVLFALVGALMLSRERKLGA